MAIRKIVHLQERKVYEEHQPYLAENL